MRFILHDDDGLQVGMDESHEIALQRNHRFTGSEKGKIGVGEGLLIKASQVS